MSATLPLRATPAPAVNTAARRHYFSHHGAWAPGVRMFRRMHFATKAATISLTFLLPLLCLLGWLLTIENDNAWHARQDATRQHVEVAHGVIEAAHARELLGELTREQAQTLARETVRALRYNESEYFWINDLHPRVVMHPIKPAMEGQDASAIRDPNGLALFQAFANLAKTQGQGFVAYQWPRPGDTAPVDKLSYVKAFKPWGWVVGSGIYVDDLRVAARTRLQTVGAVLGLAMAVALYLFVCFFKVMDGGLQETRRHLRAMTDGDLTTTPSPWGKDEAAQLMLDMREMQLSLRNMVRNVRAASDEIVHSSSEIASGAQDLSTRTEESAANLQRSAAAMEELVATTRNTDDQARHAAQLARHNAGVATQGSQVMGDVVNTMEGIRASSAQIGEIIGTVDGIAFQTNILALNAAVEAARAGEQGRGFAVVASEVRALAKRSAEAARQIKVLVGKSVEQVETGTHVVRQAGDTIHGIVGTSREMTSVLDGVAQITQEQSAGIGQIGDAVQDLDRVTQQNAALVEQTAAAAMTMNEQARQLVDEVARFRLP